jgi:hypothetical protein
VDNGGLRYGAAEGALRPPLPTATQSALHNPTILLALHGRKNRRSLDRSVGAQHHRLDPRKRTLGGRLQIGTVAGFGSESVTGFLLDLVAGFVGIRRLAGVDPKATLAPCFLVVCFHQIGERYGREAQNRRDPCG